MIILLIGGMAILGTMIVASLSGSERYQERREIARMVREHDRRRPNRAYRYM